MISNFVCSYDKDSKELRLATPSEQLEEEEFSTTIPEDTLPKISAPTHEPAVQKVTPTTTTKVKPVASPPPTPTKTVVPPAKTVDPPKATVTPNANVPVKKDDVEEEQIKEDKAEVQIKEDKAEAVMVSKDSKSIQTVSSTVENKLAMGYRYLLSYFTSDSRKLLQVVRNLGRALDSNYGVPDQQSVGSIQVVSLSKTLKLGFSHNKDL